MKKILIMFLLTALCLTVLTSCDLGNGLVAELFGELNQEDILAEDAILVDPEQWGTVEVETVPTETDMNWEDYTYDVTGDIGVAYPDVLAGFAIHSIACDFPEGTEYMETVDGSVLGTEVALRHDILSISLLGTATLYAGDCTVGYRIGEECIFDESFWGYGTDSEPEYRDLRIEIPAEQLADGYNEITLIYEMGGVIYEIGSVVVFKEVPTTEVETAVPDTEYPVPPEEETETEPEIEFPEIDIE